MRPYKKYNKAFTLIELAIVLAIVGLIAAGVLTGQSLLRQSQINSAMADIQRYISAVGTFQQKYNALPGDMPNATTYWGSMPTCPTYAGVGTVSPGGTFTCNGNGNGQIGDGYGGGSHATYASPVPEEIFFIWQHLSNAQLTQGQYNGIVTGNPYPKINMPAGGLVNSTISISYLGTIANFSSNYPGNYGHVFLYGAPNISMNGPISLLTTLEAQGFDTKFDDGAPATGTVRPPATGTCTIGSGSSYTYNVIASNANSQGIQCSLIIITGF